MASQLALQTKVDEMPVAENIMDRTILLSLSLHRWGVTKKVSSSSVETDADKALINVSKRLVDCDAYTAIVKADNAFAASLRCLALPSMFRSGIYAVPVALLDRVDRMITRYQDERAVLVGEFCYQYQGAVNEAESRLGSLYDPSNYPNVEFVRSSFSLEYRYVSTSVPDKLRMVRADIFARETEKAKAEVESMASEVRNLLRASMRDLLAHAAERLMPGPDGKRKKFHDTLVSNIRDFLSTFRDRNITQDSELESIVAQVEVLTDGIEPDLLREDAGLRDEVQKAFAGFSESLGGMIVDRPTRKLRRMGSDAGAANE